LLKGIDEHRRLPCTDSAPDELTSSGVRDNASVCHLVLLKGFVMLEMLAVILIVMWLLGMVSSYTMGGVIHLLLVVAVVLFLVRVIGGRRLQ
jgi:Family of unknown function (DUF5670)